MKSQSRKIDLKPPPTSAQEKLTFVFEAPMNNGKKEKKEAREKHIPTTKEEVTTLVVTPAVQGLGHGFSPEEEANKVNSLGIKEFEGFGSGVIRVLSGANSHDSS